jgi:hypothetical protein
MILSGLVAAAGLAVLTTAHESSAPYSTPKTYSSSAFAPYTQAQQVPAKAVASHMPAPAPTPKPYIKYEPILYAPYQPEPYHEPHHHHHKPRQPEEYMPHQNKRRASYEKPEDEYYVAEHPDKHGHHHHHAKTHLDVYREPQDDYDLYSGPEYTKPKHASKYNDEDSYSSYDYSSGKRKGHGGKGKKRGEKGGVWNKNKKQGGKDWGYGEEKHDSHGEEAVYGDEDKQNNYEYYGNEGGKSSGYNSEGKGWKHEKEEEKKKGYYYGEGVTEKKGKTYLRKGDYKL